MDLHVTVSRDTSQLLRLAWRVGASTAVIGITASNVRSQGRTAALLGMGPLRPVD